MQMLPLPFSFKPVPIPYPSGPIYPQPHPR